MARDKTSKAESFPFSPYIENIEDDKLDSHMAASRATAETVPMPLTSSHFLAQQPLQQTFAGPSHQYDLYRQQSSLPLGAVAQTFALNESEGFYSNDMWDVANTNAMLDPVLPEESAGLGSGLSMSTVMALDAPYPLQQARSSFPMNLTPPQPPTRAWPGMHQQAALLAKAQADTQARALAQRSLPADQRPRASSGAAATRPADSHVESSISRVIDQMRRNSGLEPVADEHVTRLRKEEEEMDDDERLLASEEGKKLTSKERRQLRNKVSARAFRSRRKEYIGQLEGELHAKSVEADELRVQNETLAAENARLTDLTRALLSSTHFSGSVGDVIPPQDSKGRSTGQQASGSAAKNIQSQPFDTSGPNGRGQHRTEHDSDPSSNHHAQTRSDVISTELELQPSLDDLWLTRSPTIGLGVRMEQHVY